jgi:CO dehydrogenase/acetyl-CoA synthase delta subunit
MQAESFRYAAGSGTTTASRRGVWCRVDDWVRREMGAVTVRITATATVTLGGGGRVSRCGRRESWACGSGWTTRERVGPQLLTRSEA